MANETVETLCNAARAGDLDRVREIIAAEPRLAYQEMADNNEHQAIHFAAEAGNADVVRLLLDAGADPDSPFTINVAGETVKQWGHTLWIAANQNHYEVVKLLLEAGANPNAAVYASGSALSNANLRGYKETAELLYRYGATDDL